MSKRKRRKTIRTGIPRATWRTIFSGIPIRKVSTLQSLISRVENLQRLELTGEDHKTLVDVIAYLKKKGPRRGRTNSR